MKRILLPIVVALITSMPLLAQQKQDTTKKNTVAPQPAAAKKNSEFQKDSITDMGVAIAPSSIRFRTKPGTVETKQITITNDTYKPQRLKLSFADFSMDDNGKTEQLPVGQNYEFGISKWLSISPGLVELKPGEKKKVTVTLNIPEDPSALRAGWGQIMIDQTPEKEFLAPDDKSDKKYVMGVIPVFSFVVWVYQNPPNVQINKVDILKFLFNYNKENRFVTLVAKNNGTGMGFCKAFIDIQNTNTGYNERQLLRQFTIFPGRERSLQYTLPGKLPKGKYIATAVLDFGSDTEAVAIDLDFTVDE